MASLAPAAAAEVELRNRILGLVSEYKIHVTSGTVPPGMGLFINFARDGRGDVREQYAFRRAINEARAALSGLEGGPYRILGQMWHLSNRTLYRATVRGANFPYYGLGKLWYLSSRTRYRASARGVNWLIDHRGL